MAPWQVGENFEQVSSRTVSRAGGRNFRAGQLKEAYQCSPTPEGCTETQAPALSASWPHELEGSPSATSSLPCSALLKFQTSATNNHGEPSKAEKQSSLPCLLCQALCTMTEGRHQADV